MTRFNESSSGPTLRRVAVIGSGLAGLTAGLRLSAQGLDVSVFEKSRGPGGRLASKRLPEGAADIGAQYFTIRNPEFQQFLDEFAGAESYSEWPGSLRYQVEKGEWQDFLPARRYVGVPRMTAISRALSRHLDTHYQARISRLESLSGNRWRLLDDQGGDRGSFDLVIMTAPPAQTIDLLLKSGLESLTQCPPLQDIRMLPCWTVMAHFAEPLGLACEGLQPRSDVLQWAGNNSSKPGRSDAGEWWVLHARPAWSDENQEADPETVRDAMVRAFRETTNIEQRPDTILSHRWLYARADTPDGPGHLWFGQEGLAVIGDWLQGGRVEGAFNSAESLLRQWREDGLIQPQHNHL